MTEFTHHKGSAVEAIFLFSFRAMGHAIEFC
jgi:hypothetical protein